MDWANKKNVIRELRINGEALKYASPDLQDNKEVVITAVSNTALAITYASTRLKDDIDVFKIVLNLNPFAIIYFSQRLKEKYMKETIKKSKNYTFEELKYQKRQVQKKIQELETELNDTALIVYKNKLQDINASIETEKNKNE